MEFTSFEALCRDVGKAAGIDSPIVAQDESGDVSLSIQVDAVNITLLQAPLQPAGAVLILTELGPIPRDSELQVMRASLDVNFQLLGQARMSIFRSVERGDAVLQATFDLKALSSDNVYEVLVGLSGFAHEWRSEHFLADGFADHAARLAALLSRPSTGTCDETFATLCIGLCEVAGVSAPDMMPDEAGGLAIEIDLQGVRVVIAQHPRLDSEQLLLMATFGPLPAEQRLEACRALLNINCQSHSLGYAFACNPAGGDVVLKQLCAVGEISPQDLYQRLVQMVEGIHGWRQHHFLETTDEQSSMLRETSS